MFSGISQSSLNVVALGIVGVFILGAIIFLYWKYIAIGALALFTVVVLANQSILEKKVEVEISQEIQKPIEKPVVHPIEKPVEQVITETPKEEYLTKESEDKPLFMEDCLMYTDYTKQKCESIWEGREQKSLGLLDVENVQYKKRRAEALKKPGAVVAHFTLQDKK